MFIVSDKIDSLNLFWTSIAIIFLTLLLAPAVSLAMKTYPVQNSVVAKLEALLPTQYFRTNRPFSEESERSAIEMHNCIDTTLSDVEVATNESLTTDKVSKSAPVFEMGSEYTKQITEYFATVM